MNLAIGILHGMGSQKSGYSRETQNQLKKNYEREGGNPAELFFEEILWAEVLADKQTVLFEDSSDRHELGYAALRKFIVTALGDAIAYQQVPNLPPRDSVYAQVHACVRDHLYMLASRAGAEAPLILLGHSLGGVIISNYVWDTQKEVGKRGFQGATSLERMETLAGIITCGTALPLWSLRYPTFDKIIAFPGDKLTAEQKQIAAWYNFYDRDDVLAYPLKQASAAYAALPYLNDFEVNVGNLLQSWNPTSHEGYWTDKDMLEPIARLLLHLQAHTT